MLKYAGIIIFLVLAVVIGFFFGEILFGPIIDFVSGVEGSASLLRLVGLVVVAVAFLVLHIILHEAGHLLMGKLSGYRFVSFRVYSLMIVNENGKLKRKKFHVTGTAGQALMSPPEMKNGTFPSVFYNLGGCLMNLLVSALCFWLFWILPAPWSVFFFVGMLPGLFTGLANLIPFRIGGMPNDGYTALLLGRRNNPAAHQAFWVTLRANAELASGVRPREFPTAWFDWVDMEQLRDPLVASAALLKYNYLLDRMDLVEARAFAKGVLGSTEQLLNVHRNELLCELMFHELIGACRKSEIDRLSTGELKNYMDSTSTYASRQRLLYAYSRLFMRNADTAARHLKLFEKACAQSASLGEIPGERELVALVDAIADGATPPIRYAAKNRTPKGV
ncbi:MAG: hypothetical protein FWC72_06370 [Oscillospiraceae bacterium]|nr:hypothetical protein [Oscillospiraceae bacterium]